jgi:hypothetical protein
MMIRKHEPRVPDGVDVTRPSNTDQTPLNGPTVAAVARLAA